MKLKELLMDITPTAMTADPDMEIADICYDSRAVGLGDLFVAIAGLETDGHQYIPAAVTQGAVAVVCQQIPAEEIPYILVEDSRTALALISARYFGQPAKEMKLIGVTGTNGKTTTTLLLKSVLEQCLKAKVGLIGTNENMVGDEVVETERTTPESYELQKLFRQMADAGCTYVVMEVSSHALALSRVAGLRFAVGVFTNLSQDHLDFHKDMDNYARAKALLFTQSGKGVINIDDDYAQVMLRAAEDTGCHVLTFSVDKNEADLMAKNIRLKTGSVEFSVLVPGQIQRMVLHIPGEFSVYNALGVVGCACCLNIPLEKTADALGKARGVKGRVEVVQTDGDYTILIDYAHTPDALENVLTAVRGFAQGGRTVVLFGCGGDRDPTKRGPMGKIAAELADHVIVTSDNPRTEEPNAIIEEIVAGMQESETSYVTIEDRRAAIAYAIDNHQPGDIIVLAGKGHETYQEINKVKHHMDEREIVAAHIASRAG
ncbi:MAG: UDP-N-acetylmuramoyl-L-alanyl-D-glutamate--2,6-diaminopimelate ligase [Oscillospiraceae bacterium]|nr:UDP-N-acetylmuramoyl-L-alanyl-D-glutamate--2,6-diaminopimelate ligase [Oscillospiraceae bacterium]